jgi:hypothetical protein
MNSPFSQRVPVVFKLYALLALTLCLTPAVARGQQELVTDMTAPPPMRYVSRDERAQLSAINDPKLRTQASLLLAEGHLRHAEDSTFTRTFSRASAALGRYQAVMEDALGFLVGMNIDNKKMRDIFKRLEMTLRTHIIRIEAIRRETPYDYAVNVKSTLEYARSARTQALNTFFSDTVVRDVLQDKEKPSTDGNSKDSASGSPKKQL